MKTPEQLREWRRRRSTFAVAYIIDLKGNKHELAGRYTNMDAMMLAQDTVDEAIMSYHSFRNFMDKYKGPKTSWYWKWISK
jgi:hypothetical protein